MWILFRNIQFRSIGPWTLCWLPSVCIATVVKFWLWCSDCPSNMKLCFGQFERNSDWLGEMTFILRSIHCSIIQIDGSMHIGFRSLNSVKQVGGILFSKILVTCLFVNKILWQMGDTYFGYRQWLLEQSWIILSSLGFKIDYQNWERLGWCQKKLLTRVLIGFPALFFFMMTVHRWSLNLRVLWQLQQQ